MWVAVNVSHFPPHRASHILITMCCASQPVLLQPREVTITKHYDTTDAQTSAMNPGQFTQPAAGAVYLTYMMYSVDHFPDLPHEVGKPCPPRGTTAAAPSHPVPPREGRWSRQGQNPTTAHLHYTPLKSLQ